MTRYPIVTLCGSTRFRKEFEEVQKKLTLDGNIVISVGVFGHAGDGDMINEDVKAMLDDMHKCKIDIAEEIFVINAGGYIGESTRSEIIYAQKAGKKIRFLEKPAEEYLKMTYKWDDFHALPFEVRQAVREFRKEGTNYSDSSDVWNHIPENEIDQCEFKKAMQLYDALLTRNRSCKCEI